MAHGIYITPDIFYYSVIFQALTMPRIYLGAQIYTFLMTLSRPVGWVLSAKFIFYPKKSRALTEKYIFCVI